MKQNLKMNQKDESNSSKENPLKKIKNTLCESFSQFETLKNLYADQI